MLTGKAELCSSATASFPDFLLILAAPLLEPFHLQEGKVSFVENKFCNMLYGLAKGKNVSVQEDMLCAGDFSTGTSICLVSKTLSVLPSPVLGASVSLGTGCVASALFVEPLGTSRFLLHAPSWAPSLGSVPQAKPLPKLLAHEAIYSICS